MIGRSPAFLSALKLITKFSQCDATVLIEGETGTGKELAARAIHYKSGRHNKPFVAVNCGALPDQLIENELFGHRRGAFTDARVDSPGLVSLAEGGTLFLDEIDSLSPKAQVIFLRIMQDQRFRPLGALREEQADIRIVAASNQNLQQLVNQGLFRSDLLFRLNLLYVELPPLRMRHGDVKVLANEFLQQYSQRYKRAESTLTPSTLTWFDAYHWPGNVRELENLIHREFLLTDGDVLDIAPPSPLLSREIRVQEKPSISNQSAQQFDASYAAAKAEVINQFSEQYLHALMTQAAGNVSRAARDAGKERRSLERLLKRYGISPASYRG
jgi:two-component system, NtrC family, response regulator GlrR